VGQVELDALTLLPSYGDMSSMEIEPRYPAQGDLITITLHGGTPSDPFYLLVSGDRASMLIPPFFGGFGAIMLDRDHPFFMAGLYGIMNLGGTMDPSGRGTYSTTLPMDPIVVDFHLQAWEPGAPLLSHPLTMEMNQ
jgi:hypothetical protein